MNLFRFVPGYESAIYEPGKEPLFFLFLAFLIAFALARLYTRLGRSRGWGSGTVGGVHLHHAVPGVVLLFVGGVIAFTPLGEGEVVREVAAILFGAGAALVFDEFALIFHLKDVYWSQEGRTSVNAAVLGVMLAGLLLVSSSPFDSESAVDESKTAFFVAVSTNVFFAVATFLKGKPFLGTLAVFVSVVGWVAALRLAKPTSPWARWFYDPGAGRWPERRARKLARSTRRFERSRFERFHRWFVDLVGGKPDSGCADG
jgi:lysyl-tRNA synthetase class 2